MRSPEDGEESSLYISETVRKGSGTKNKIESPRTLARRLGTYAQGRLAARIECVTGSAWLLPFSSPDGPGNWGEERQSVWEGGVERVRRPAVGVRRKAKTDWHTMNS